MINLKKIRQRLIDEETKRFATVTRSVAEEALGMTAHINGSINGIELTINAVMEELKKQAREDNGLDPGDEDDDDEPGRSD
jgi:hypothetical protein